MRRALGGPVTFYNAVRSMATSKEEEIWARRCAAELKFQLDIFAAEKSEFLPDLEEEYDQLTHELRTCIFDFASGKNISAARLQSIYDRCQPPNLLSLIEEKRQHEAQIVVARKKAHERLIKAALAKSAHNAKQQEYWRKRKQAVARARRDAQKDKP